MHNYSWSVFVKILLGNNTFIWWKRMGCLRSFFNSKKYDQGTVSFTLQMYIRIIFRTLSKCKVELFVKIVNGFQPLTILSKSSIFDVWLNSEYAFDWDSFLTLFIQPNVVWIMGGNCSVFLLLITLFTVGYFW